MPEFIKAYNEGGDTIFEMSVKALTEKGATAQGVISLLGRRPAEISAVKEVYAVKISTGLVNEYRVVVTLEDDKSLRDMFKINEAAKRFEELV